MSDKIKLYWVREDKGAVVANVLGYATHNNMMKKYGEKYFEYTEDADIALNITPADHFVPIPGKKNILFTMWESLDIPDSYKRNLNKADLIIVPSAFCRDIFRPHTSVPIVVCGEGIEPDKYKFFDREFPLIKSPFGLAVKDGKRFRLLWLGAPNPRKGYHSVLELVKVMENNANFEVYIKTTAFPKSTNKEFVTINWRRLIQMCKKWNDKKLVKSNLDAIAQSFKRKMQPDRANRVQVMGKHKNVIIDTRKLPQDELEGLYHSAHAFLSPHCGEGWNLPLCEAMATGLPCVATGASGCMDFFNEEVGYPIKYIIKEVELQNYDFKTRMFIPDTNDLFNRVIEIFKDYDRALAKGKRASARIHSKFLWTDAASRLNDIVKEFACVN
jgi:glycosyltransferase involved in cell wall biosynthesis